MINTGCDIALPDCFSGYDKKRFKYVTLILYCCFSVVSVIQRKI